MRLSENLLGSEDSQQETLVRIDQYECSSMLVVRDLLLKILVGFQVPILKRTTDVGDICFKDEEGFVVVFARREVIYTLRNAGRQPQALIMIATVLDQRIVASL